MAKHGFSYQIINNFTCHDPSNGFFLFLWGLTFCWVVYKSVWCFSVDYAVKWFKSEEMSSGNIMKHTRNDVKLIVYGYNVDDGHCWCFDVEYAVKWFKSEENEFGQHHETYSKQRENTCLWVLCRWWSILVFCVDYGVKWFKSEENEFW